MNKTLYHRIITYAFFPTGKKLNDVPFAAGRAYSDTVLMSGRIKELIGI